MTLFRAIDEIELNVLQVPNSYRGSSKPIVNSSTSSVRGRPVTGWRREIVAYPSHLQILIGGMLSFDAYPAIPQWAPES